MGKLSKESFGTTPVYFQAAMAKALRKEETMKKRHMATMVAVAMMILALACTALAVGLNQSARHSAVRTAREALMAEYGLDNEGMGMLYEHAEATKDGWVVSFNGVKYVDEIGEYTVTISRNGVASVTWTHDGADKEVLQSADLSGGVWGAAQLKQVAEIERAYNNQPVFQGAVDEDAKAYSMEAMAERDRILAEASAVGLEPFVMHVMPGEGEMSEAEAVAYAKKILLETYEMDEAVLGEALATLLKYKDKPAASYRIYLEVPAADGEEASDSWAHVIFDAATGAVEHAWWVIAPELRTLPEGALDDYEEAVLSFIEEGAFAVRSPAEKAELAARIQAAGYGSSLTWAEYIAPSEQDMAEADAYAAAEKALSENHGFTEAGYALFDTQIALILEDGIRTWVIEYKPNLGYSSELERRVGIYEVFINAQTGEAIQTAWSLEDARGAEAYTKATFGQAEAWDGAMLPWVAALAEARNAILLPYEEASRSGKALDWSVEDMAAADQLMRDAGFNPAKYYNGLPGAGDISEAQAIDLAKQVVREEFDADDAMLETARAFTLFSVGDPEKSLWIVHLYPADSGYEFYEVHIDSKTSEIHLTEFIATGNG